MNVRLGPNQADGMQLGRGVGVGKRPNAWIRFASSGWDSAPAAPEERELARRSRLTAWLILGLFVGVIVLIPGGFAASATLVALATVALGLVVALVLNREGFVTSAGSLLSLLLSGAVLFAVASTGKLALVYLPAFDLFVISVVISASVLSGIAAFWFAALNVTLIVVDFFVQPHADDLVSAISKYGVASLIARPIALQIIVATVAYLWIRGTTEAIQRADRAEEVAKLEHAVAEQRRQIEVAAQQLLETHVRAANGDYGARANITQDNLLWQVGVSLNNLLARLQKSGQAEYMLRRTDEELRRLAMAIDDAQAGRKPIWPAPTGTAADLILERITGRGPSQMAGGYPQPGQQPYAPSLIPPGMPSGMMPEQLPSSGPLSADWGAYGASAPTSDPRRGAFQNPNQQENPWFQPPDGQGW